MRHPVQLTSLSEENIDGSKIHPFSVSGNATVYLYRLMYRDIHLTHNFLMYNLAVAILYTTSYDRPEASAISPISTCLL